MYKEEGNEGVRESMRVKTANEERDHKLVNQKDQEKIAVQSEQDDVLSNGRQNYRDGELGTKEVHETASFGRLHAKRTKSSENDRQQNTPPQTLELVRGKPVVDRTEIVPRACVDISGRSVVDVLGED